MPIYEFYCRSCHTVYSFYARSTQTQADPACPKCQRKPLERKLSRFAISKGLSEDRSSDGMDGLDESKMEAAMMSMADQLESVDENDPRAMASMMRKLFQTTGMQPDEAIQEAMRRMEAGEDPDQIEEELGPELDASDPDAMFSAGGGTKGKLRRWIEAPNVDPGLYDL